MNGLSDLRMFAEIAGASSLSVAAGRLGMSPATISGRLKAMEEHYGVVLVRRTTRALSLTDDGRVLLQRAQSVLEGFRDLEQAMTGRKRVLRGQLIVSSPLDFGRRYVSPMVCAFLQRYPDLEFELRFDQGEPPSERSFDLAFRIGPQADSTLITRRIGETRIITCASPDYLSRCGLPILPADLLDHHCLSQAGENRATAKWSYRLPEGETTIDGPVTHSANDAETLMEMALAGHGILRALDFNVAEAIAAGRLVRLLTGFEPEPLTIHLLSERRHLMPLRAVQFMDFATERVGQKAGSGRAPVLSQAAA